ncbi:50S ribosomal protein L18Ae [Methanolapillus millepedarum]|uniref:Large ribosomal subunit protein eL20 n=1 Tax=Methanolapillus millepedarum TaxID=3028296 RepID=A0AA96ZVC4_9EURY|nr:hypothetical protein MsAc7_02210 [Methanosarcinaceae archaeon Ac7]
MPSYTVTGKFKPGFFWEPFTKTVESQNEKNALDKVYSTIGSKHRLERRSIKIESIKEV